MARKRYRPLFLRPLPSIEMARGPGGPWQVPSWRNFHRGNIISEPSGNFLQKAMENGDLMVIEW